MRIAAEKLRFAGTRRTTKRRPGRAERRESRELFLLCLPAMLKVFVFSYLPFIGLIMAFQNYVPRRGIFGSAFIGLDNFKFLFTSNIATRLIVNAVSINLFCILFGTLFSLLLGLFLQQVGSKLFLRLTQTVLIFPYFVSWPLVGVLVQAFLSDRTGMITNLLYTLTGNRVDFYNLPNYWHGIITFTSVWKTAGLSAVVYYALLMGVDKALYEAAAIDGAGRFRSMWHVSLPALKLYTVLNLITFSANILRIDLNMVYFVTNNSATLYPKTDVIETYMFRALRTDGRFSISMATGLIQAVVGCALTVGVNYLSKRVAGESLF